MKRKFRSLLTTLVILVILWQLWQRVHFVVWVNIPWWGALILVVVLFIALDLLMDRLFGKTETE